MTPIQISLSKITMTPRQEIDLPVAHRALWLQSGTATINDHPMKTEDGRYTDDSCTIFNGGPQQVVLLNFEIRKISTPLPANQGHDLLLSETTTIDDGEQIVRLDKVTFPAGSRAYRHIHPGPGIRYLTKGNLEVQSDHAAKMMLPHGAWFEGANSPVVAVASSTQESEFVRVLVLPRQFEGKPTLKLLNDEDKIKPKLQKNLRYFDYALNLSWS